MTEGKVDFLPVKDLTAGEMEEEKRALVELHKSRRTGVALVDGARKEFQVGVGAGG